MQVREFDGNCGMIELMELARQTPKAILTDFADDFFHTDEKWNEKTDDYTYTHTPKYGLVVFSDILPKRDRKSPGMKLFEYIKEQGLGEVSVSHPAKNPNSPNTICAWMWTPNEKYVKLYKATLP